MKNVDWPVVGTIVLFAVAIVLSLLYGIWYVNNCAFVPLAEAPTLCVATSSR